MIWIKIKLVSKIAVLFESVGSENKIHHFLDKKEGNTEGG
jgi:hypothetical protein